MCDSAFECDTTFECDTDKIDIRPLFVVLWSDLPQAPDKENTLCFYKQPKNEYKFHNSTK